MIRAYYFIPASFSNGTMGTGGVATEAFITLFKGAFGLQSGLRPGPGTYVHPPAGGDTLGRWYRRCESLARRDRRCNP